MGLKLSPSNLEVAFATKPELSRYAERLKKLDTDQNGELELDEVCQVVQDLVEAEKSRRILKLFSIIMAGLLFLTIAATTGLTYAVVALSKETRASEGLILERATGDPMLTGSPHLAVIYDPNDAASLAEIFNNTEIAEITGQGRRLMAAEDFCTNPSVKALATAKTEYVLNRCKYINKQGTDTKFTLKVTPNVNPDCDDIDTRTKAACGTVREHVQVTDDQCVLMTKPPRCSTPGQKYPVGLIWADAVKTERATSFYISCLGICGDNKKVSFTKCGVARSQCPKTSTSTALNGRRLQGASYDDRRAMDQLAMPAFDIFGMKMNCESGACKAYAAV